MADLGLSFKNSSRRNTKAKSEKQSKFSEDTDLRRYEMDNRAQRGVQTPDLVTIQEEQKKDRSPHKFIVEEIDNDDEDGDGEQHAANDN